jgi:choline kinase/phosphatidylglycerophosphate synthase
MRWSHNHGPTTDVPCCIILAAGEGRRLSMPEKDPKPTHEVLGLSLGERTILACMAAGVSRFLVVLGSQAEAVRAHFAQVSMRRGCAIEFVVAGNWHLGNGMSALAARASITDDRFLLVMADHLVSATLIQKVLHTALGDREVCLAVDQDAARVFDLDDATKVQIEHGMIECIGKDLSVWNAIDTGVFLATPALFGALAGAAAQGRYALSHGIEELAEAGQARAVDVTGQPWLDVDTPDSFQEAQRRLLGSLGKNGADGFISTHVNRRLSVPLSALLVRTPVTPTQISLGSFFIALVGAAFFTVDQLWASIVAACLVQLSSVIDGCDGEVARLRHLATSRGAWVDTMLDRYADTAIVMAITLGYAAGHPGVLPWLGGLAASTGFLLASYSTKEFALTHGVPYPDNVLNRLKRRDLRLLVMCCGGLARCPFYAMVVMGLLTHGLIVGILVNGWRFRPPDARAALVLSRQSFPDRRETADGRPDYQKPRPPRPRVTRYGTT